MKKTVKDLALRLKAHFSDIIAEPVEFRGECTCPLLDSNRLHEVAEYLKDQLDFDFLKEATSIDEPDKPLRFTLVYELYSYYHRVQLRLKTSIAEGNGKISSLSDLWASANWQEREIYDLMGIQFENHPDLRRILMWDGYPFHPLRKDFPLEGKASECGVLFTRPAPMEGGPFVTQPGLLDDEDREPRSRTPENKF